MVQYKQHYSKRVLFQLIVLSMLLALVILINLDFIQNIYLKNQATNTGYIVNGSILGLFALGLFRLISILLRYGREENALKKFLLNIEDDEVRPIDNINEKTLIHRRYSSVVEISRQNVAVNHSALAASHGSAAVVSATSAVVAVPIILFGSSLAISGAALQEVGKGALELGTDQKITTQAVQPDAMPTLD